MKKHVLLAFFGAFIALGWVGCEPKLGPDPEPEPDVPTVKIDPDECYMLQEFNESGEPVDSYKCIVFEKNAGRTFKEAFNSIKSDLDALVNRNISEEKDGGNYDTSLWEVRQIIRNVKNSPDEKLVYTSIELYIFSIVYNSYTIVHQYCVIDSEGNIYQIASQID